MLGVCVRRLRRRTFEPLGELHVIANDLRLLVIGTVFGLLLALAIIALRPSPEPRVVYISPNVVCPACAPCQAPAVRLPQLRDGEAESF